MRGDLMKPMRVLIVALAAAVPMLPCAAADDASFTLEARAKDFAAYFPSYLANGYFSTMTSPRGTEANLAYMVAFMDYAHDDISRPAAVPGWSEIDYNAGGVARGRGENQQQGKRTHSHHHPHRHPASAGATAAARSVSRLKKNSVTMTSAIGTSEK